MFPDIEKLYTGKVPAPATEQATDHLDNIPVPLSVDTYANAPVTINPVQVLTNKTGRNAPSFYDVLSNELFVLPTNDFNLGSVFNTTVFDILLWNTGVNAVTFTGIVVHGILGATLQGTPGTITPGGTGTLVMTVLGEGPPSTDGQFELEFSDAPNVFIKLKCTRIVLVSGLPDWSGEVKTSYAFETILTKAKSLQEQRRPLITRPTRTVSFSATESDYQMQQIRNLIKTNPDKRFAVPLFHEPLILKSKSGLILEFSESFEHCWNLRRYTKYLYCYNLKTNTAGVVEIANRSANMLSVNIVQDIAMFTWEPYVVVVFPMIIGYVQNTSFTTHTCSTETISIDFVEIKSSEQPALVPGPVLDEFPLPCDWGKSPGDEFELIRTHIAYAGGVDTFYKETRMAPSTMSKSYVCSKEEEFALLDFFAQKRGKYASFYEDTSTIAFTLTEDIVQGAQSFVAHTNYSDSVLLAGDKLTLITAEDEFILTVNSVSAPNAITGTQIITVNEEFSKSIAKSDANVYIKRKVRFGSDELSLTYMSPNASQTSVTFYELIEG